MLCCDRENSAKSGAELAKESYMPRVSSWENGCVWEEVKVLVVVFYEQTITERMSSDLPE